MNPRDSSPHIASKVWPVSSIAFLSNAMVDEKASLFARMCTMSLKIIPFLGKSGMSLISEAISLMFIV